MNNLKIIGVVVVLLVVIWVVSRPVRLGSPSGTGLGPLPPSPLSATDVVPHASLAGILKVASSKAVNTNDELRFRYLEQLGEVPRGASLHDIALASKTTWWGKPLDPKKFWQGRVVWCDRSAKAAAAARGRAWPPMPYDDPSLGPYPDDDGLKGIGMGEEGAGANAASSSKEGAFWCKFIETHPRPPEAIEYKQVTLARLFLQIQKHEQELSQPQQVESRISVADVRMLLRAAESRTPDIEP